MRCQACPKHATHTTSHGTLRAQCCSAQCGRDMFAGISTNDAGVIRVAALSPLGAAIAQRTQHNVDYSMPVHVAAALIGALQRIGPAQPTSDADLPASAQPGDVPVVSRNWILETPRDVWQSVILPYLQPGDASAFARTSRASARVAQQDLDMRRAIRAKYTAYDAAWHYLIGAVNNEEAAEMRRAYPVAEMALALLLAYQHNLLRPLGWTAAQYIARFRELRTECGRDGEALFTTPIVFPYREQKLINGFLTKAGSATPMCAAAILLYAKEYYKRPFGESGTLHALLAEVHTKILHPYETPETPSFFATQYIIGTSVSAGQVPDFEYLVKRGVSFDRYDAAMWIVHEALYGHSAGDEFRPIVERSNFHSVKLRKAQRAALAQFPMIRYDIPRTKTGQLSLLFMFHGILYQHNVCLVDIMRRNGTLELALTEPSRYNVENSPPILFSVDDPTIRGTSAYRYIIQGYLELDKTLLWRQKFDGVRAFIYYLHRLPYQTFVELVGYAVDYRFNQTDYYLVWRPYSLESPKLLEDLPKTAKRLKFILKRTSEEANDASYDLVLLTKEIGRRAQALHAKMHSSSGSEDDVRDFNLLNNLLYTISNCIDNPPQYASEYKQVVYPGMPPSIKSIYEDIEFYRDRSPYGIYSGIEDDAEFDTDTDTESDDDTDTDSD